MRNLTINAQRLWRELMETASIGATPKGGICRLTLTEQDRQARDWFKQRVETLGCEVTVDDMGAMFARRLGLRYPVWPGGCFSDVLDHVEGGRASCPRRGALENRYSDQDDLRVAGEPFAQALASWRHALPHRWR
jgi:hypothetical protein